MKASRQRDIERSISNENSTCEPSRRTRSMKPTGGAGIWAASASRSPPAAYRQVVMRHKDREAEEAEKTDLVIAK